MKILTDNFKICCFSFKGSIDMHAHKGSWWVELTEEDAKTEAKKFSKIERNNGKCCGLYNFEGDIFERANKCITNPQDKTDKMIVSNLDCMVRNNPDITKSTNFPGGIPFLKDEISGNLELLEKSTNPNEFLYATGQPKYGNADNLRKVIEKNPEKFVGIKLHPEQLNLRADDEVYNSYMQLAQEKKLPVLFHSQVNINWENNAGTVKRELSPSDPRIIYNLAKRYPDVPVILGHTGGGGAPAHKVAIKVMKEALENKDANLFCDISWMDFKEGQLLDKPDNILELIKLCRKKDELHRILFGSDIPVGEYNKFNQHLRGGKALSPEQLYSQTVNKLKNAIRNDNDLKTDAENIIDCIFYKNAQKLFFEKKVVNPPDNKWIKTKIGVAIAVGAAILGFAIKTIKDNSTHPKQELAKVQTYKK